MNKKLLSRLLNGEKINNILNEELIDESHKNRLPSAGDVVYQAPKKSHGEPKLYKGAGKETYIDAIDRLWAYDFLHHDHWDVRKLHGNEGNYAKIGFNGKILELYSDNGVSEKELLLELQLH